MTVDNLIIDRVLDGTFFGKTSGEALFRLTQVQNASLSNSSETVDVLDAQGVLITQLDRSKSATFSFENALKDMHLLAAQAGTDITYAGNGKTISVPAFDIITTEAGKTAYTLAHTPVGGIENAYVLTPAGSFGTKLTVKTDAGKDAIAVTGKDVTISLEDGTATCKAGDSIILMYTYDEADNAAEFVNYADKFNVPMKAQFRVICYEPCAVDQKMLAILEFPSCKLSSTYDFALSAEEAQAAELQCLVDYCAKGGEKTLYRLIVVDGE